MVLSVAETSSAMNLPTKSSFPLSSLLGQRATSSLVLPKNSPLSSVNSAALRPYLERSIFLTLSRVLSGNISFSLSLSAVNSSAGSVTPPLNTTAPSPYAQYTIGQASVPVSSAVKLRLSGALYVPALNATLISPSVFVAFSSRTISLARASVAIGASMLPLFVSLPSTAT